MKFIVIGNICAGKTSLIHHLKPYLEADVLQIDELRKKHGDGSFSKEYLTWSYFLEGCENASDVILEFSGAGIHRHAVYQALKKNKFKTLYVQTSIDTCLIRVKDRKILTPYPWKEISNIEETIIWLDKELRRLIQNGFWDPDVVIEGEKAFPEPQKLLEAMDY